MGKNTEEKRNVEFSPGEGSGQSYDRDFLRLNKSCADEGSRSLLDVSCQIVSTATLSSPLYTTYVYGKIFVM
jgi:hypothetical protein